MPSRPCLLRGAPGPRAATPGRQPRCARRATHGCPRRSTARSRRASCPTQTRWRSRPRRPRRARVVRRSRPPRPGRPVARLSQRRAARGDPVEACGAVALERQRARARRQGAARGGDRDGHPPRRWRTRRGVRRPR